MSIITQQEWDAAPGSGWTLFNNSGTASIDPAPAGGSSPSGSGALKLTIPSGSRGQGDIYGQAVYNFLSPLPNAFWIGYWIKWSSNWLWHPVGSKHLYMYGQVEPENPAVGEDNVLLAHYPPTGTFPFTPGAASGGLLITVQDVWAQGGAFNFTPSPNYSFQLNRWYWIQQHLVMNSPGSKTDGTWEIWIGDSTTGVVTHVLTSAALPLRSPTAAAGFTHVNHANVYGGGGPLVTIPTAQSFWIDHTVIATSQVETNMPGGITPPPDTTPPAAPTGLVVV